MIVKDNLYDMVRDDGEPCPNCGRPIRDMKCEHCGYPCHPHDVDGDPIIFR